MGVSDRGVRAVDVAVRRPVLLRVIHALSVLLRLGALEAGPGQGGARGPGRAAQCVGHDRDADREFVAHLHDDAAPRHHVQYRSHHDQAVARHRQRHLDANQHPPAHRQRGVRRCDRGRVRELPLPRRQDRRGARPLRLDGLRRQLHRDLCSDRAAVCGLLAGPRDLSVRPVHGHHDDGRLHELAVGDPGLPDRRAVPGEQLLPLDRHGPHPGGGAVPAVYQVPVDGAGVGRAGLGHTAYDDRRHQGAGGDGRLAPPAARRPGRDERQEHRRQSDDPDHVPVLPLVSPRQ